MKALTTFAIGLLSLTVVGSALAQSSPTVIRITGSSAYRGQVHGALAHLMGASGTGSAVGSALSAGNTYGYVGSSLSSASQAIFKGNIAGTDVIIKTSWSGSVAGVLTVSQSQNVNFLDDGVTTTDTGTSGLAAGTTAEIPDIAMSDTYQASTPFTSNLLDPAPKSPVGVVPFVWVSSYNSPAGLTNVTPQLAAAVFKSGSASLEMFTGSPGDAAVNVFAIGRDPDSGTRLTAFAETNVGVNTVVRQYQPVTSGTAVTSQALYVTPAPLNGIDIAVGDGGYSSGGTLADFMRFDTAALNGFYLTYLGTSDATRATSTGTAGAGNAKQLTYNGVAYSVTAVQNGTYTFWGYEHLLYRSDIPADKKTVADAVAAQIHDADAVILLNTMKVQRQTDGGVVTHN